MAHIEDCAWQIVAEIIQHMKDHSGENFLWDKLSLENQEFFKQEWIKLAVDHLKGCGR